MSVITYIGEFQHLDLVDSSCSMQGDRNDATLLGGWVLLLGFFFSTSQIYSREHIFKSCSEI